MNTTNLGGNLGESCSLGGIFSNRSRRLRVPSSFFGNHQLITKSILLCGYMRGLAKFLPGHQWAALWGRGAGAGVHRDAKKKHVKTKHRKKSMYKTSRNSGELSIWGVSQKL